LASKRTRIQLQVLTDYFGFESFCNDLMIRCGYQNIEPLGGFQDKGRDAIHVSETSGKVTIFAYSVRDDWENKLQEDLAKIRLNGHKCDKVVFATTAEPSAGQKDSWKSKARSQYKWELEFYDLERIGTLLDGPFSDLKGLHPNIFVLNMESPSTDQSKRWVHVLGAVQILPIQKIQAQGPEALAKSIESITRTNTRTLLQATAMAFDQLEAIETTCLYSCDVRGGELITELLTHHSTLVQSLQHFNQLCKTDEDTYWKLWEDFSSKWNTGGSSFPTKALGFPVGISYNRGARFIKLYPNFIKGNFHVPKNTDDFLSTIGTLVNAKGTIFVSGFGPPGHPFNKLIAYKMDKEEIDTSRIRVNADNVDEFDYVYEEYDEDQ